jgi:hypothetical protein
MSVEKHGKCGVRHSRTPIRPGVGNVAIDSGSNEAKNITIHKTQCETHYSLTAPAVIPAAI